MTRDTTVILDQRSAVFDETGLLEFGIAMKKHGARDGLGAELLGAPAQLQVSRTSGTTIFDQNLVVTGVQFEPLTVADDLAVDI